MELIANHENRLEALRWRIIQDLDEGRALPLDAYVRAAPDLAEELFDFVVEFLRMRAAAARMPYPATASPTAIRARCRALERIAAGRSASP